MATRRRVGNLLALAVLSALRQRAMHPYEMGVVLREWGKDDDMEIKWGSLYTVVRNLEKHELIEAVESTRHGARPERTVYAITVAGREELLDWVRELVSTPERERPRFKAGLSVMGVLGPAEAMELLERRLATVEADVAARREGLAAAAAEVPRIFLVETEYELAMRSAEAAWVRALVAELRSGTYPNLADWRAWHETGELTPAFTELMERGRATE